MEEKDNVVKEHVHKHVITEFDHFPEHDARVETKEFRSAKKELERVEHIPCFKCATMKNRQSHHIFERAWANGLDFKKVAVLLFTFFDFHGHCHRDFKDSNELTQWFHDHFNGRLEKVKTVGEFGGTRVDEVLHCDDAALDTIYNQLILCKPHHTGIGHGIHEMSAPAFIASLATRQGFENVLTEAEAKELLRKSGHPTK